MILGGVRVRVSPSPKRRKRTTTGSDLDVPCWADSACGSSLARQSGGKRIDLSTRLSQVCNNISGHSLTDGMAVPACVNSVEDHGYVLSFGCWTRQLALPRRCPQSLVDPSCGVPSWMW